MEKENVVLDASVVIKLFIEEYGSSKAEKLIQDHINGNKLIIVPELILFEVINALRYNKTIDEKRIINASEKLFKLQFHIERLNEFIIKKIIQLAIKYNITVYDSSYVAIAQLYGAKLVTADKALENIPNVDLI